MGHVAQNLQQDLRAQTITVCMEALYGVTGAAAMAEGIANDMGLEAADEGALALE